MKYGEEFVYIIVATVLTVYGIETEQLLEIGNHILRVVVATVLTVYGIETQLPLYQDHNSLGCNSTYRLRYWNVSDTILSMNLTELVATVLTVYGIE